MWVETWLQEESVLMKLGGGTTDMLGDTVDKCVHLLIVQQKPGILILCFVVVTANEDSMASNEDQIS